nr:miorex complex component 10 [Quercus suber]
MSFIVLVLLQRPVTVSNCLEMCSRRATYLAFHRIVQRSLSASAIVRRPQLLAETQRLPQYQDECQRHKHYFSTNTAHRPNKDDRDGQSIDGSASKVIMNKRNPSRTQAGGHSLKRVAVEAQRSRNLIKGRGQRLHVDPSADTKNVTAYCAAETYNIYVARQLMEKEGYKADPFQTGLFPQVLHVQVSANVLGGRDAGVGEGDVFVFPSGSIVTWNVPEKTANHIVRTTLSKAAVNGHLDRLELEDLQYVEDPSCESSAIVGDTIILGTQTPEPDNLDARNGNSAAADSTVGSVKHDVDTVLAKIAFSSALARSAKLAVLENSLTSYFDSTRSIPSTLSTGHKLRFTRAFILRKTGELLSIRAQLNLYSELTDSLPDIFWDSPYELGLESYYEMVGRALDVGVRIKVLNEKMDYASEIAAVLRERLSEKHSTGLEWLIIGLISVEVWFALIGMWKEHMNPESTDAMMKEWLRRELAKGESNTT